MAEKALTPTRASDTRPRMGRPKLGIVTTTVRLAREVMERIDALCGPNRRAEFIREAVSNELERRSRPSQPAPPSTKPHERAPSRAAPPTKRIVGYDMQNKPIYK